jgi:hypothetical protein
MDKAALLATARRRIVPIEIPDGRVFVRSLNIAELRPLMDALGDDPGENAALQLSAYLADESGVQLLTLDEAREFAAAAPGAVVLYIVQEGIQLNAVNDKALETARGN